LLNRIAWRRLIAGVVLSGIVACNGIAWMQARAMTHFSSGGQRTPAIEALSLPEKAWTVLTGVNVPRPQNSHTPQAVRLPYEVRTISFPGGDTLESWYIPVKQPRATVLMFPAYAESKETLLAQAVAFHEMGYDSLMVDFRGVGGSSGQDTTLGVREAKDVGRAFGYVRQTWPGRATILYGVSMGSAAVLRSIATEGVKPDAIIIESPFNRLLDTVRNRFDAMGLPSFPGAELVVFWGGVQQGFDGFAHNPVDYAQSVSCLVLLMNGDHDPRVTPTQATAIYEKLGGHKEFVSFPGAGHESLIAAAPQVWKERVSRFLDQELVKP
jgi:alpha-beta hydrolase superfamily lysophospholipase